MRCALVDLAGRGFAEKPLLEEIVRELEKFFAQWRPSKKHSPGVIYIQPAPARDGDRILTQVKEAISAMSESTQDMKSRADEAAELVEKLLREIKKELDEAASSGDWSGAWYQFKHWCERAEEVLDAFGAERVLEEFREAAGPIYAGDFETQTADWVEAKAAVLRGFMKNLRNRPEDWNKRLGKTAKSQQGRKKDSAQRAGSPRVFVVHGHDDGMKEEVARFLQKLGCLPVILHEQPNGGKTIIEKFERSSADCDFAVVLLSPDDEARKAGDSENPAPRARQNVILELGYFVGRLGRDRVASIRKGPVELPSDILGVGFIDFSKSWQNELARELEAASLPIDVKGLLR